MGDDRSQPPELIASGLAGLIDGVRRDIADLRDDFREDNRALEQRVTAQLTTLQADTRTQIETVSARQNEMREQLVEFATNHGELHEDEAKERRESHGQFYEFIRSQEISAARRDGALGVARFSVELLSKHSGRLIQVLLAVAALLGVATGAVRVGVGG